MGKEDDQAESRGTLAEQLASLDVEVRQDAAIPDEGEQAGSKSEASRPPPEAQAEPEPEPEPQLSDEELFRQAVEGISREEIFQKKFGSVEPSEPSDEPEASPDVRGPKPSTETNPPEPVLDEEEARGAVRELRDKRLMEKAFGELDERFTGSKYRERRRGKAAEPSYSIESDRDLVTPPLPKSGEGLHNVGTLNGAQRDMLKRFGKRNRAGDVREINLRGDTLEDALHNLELFVHQSWKNEEPFVRIIHGRGIHSDGEPVLKPAVLRWLEGPGFRYVRGYVPEVGSAGDYGSVVVELEPREG